MKTLILFLTFCMTSVAFADLSGTQLQHDPSETLNLTQIVEFPSRPPHQIPADSKIVFTQTLKIQAGVSRIPIGYKEGRSFETKGCSSEGCVQYTIKPYASCEILIEPVGFDRILSLGIQGYRVFDFNYNYNNESYWKNEVSHIFTLKEANHEIMKIECTNRRMENFENIYSQFFKQAGIKLILGQSKQF